MKLLFKSVLVIVCLLFPGALCRAKTLGKFQFKNKILSLDYLLTEKNSAKTKILLNIRKKMKKF